MHTYSREMKEQMVKKLLADGGPSVPELSRDTGIGESTLFAWKKIFREGGTLSASPRTQAAGFKNKDKLDAVIATAAMNAVERSAYCREHGWYGEQLDAWRAAFETVDLGAGSGGRLELARANQKIRGLQKELLRKERALAEAAALLTLSKKAQALWGTDAEA